MAKHKRIKDMEPDDVIEEETVAGDADDLLIPHTFERSLENAFAERAVVVLTLNRATGETTVDYSCSNPLEAWAMCQAGDTVLRGLINGEVADRELEEG